MKISLCIPTNGIIEWISQVIDSIYAQDVELERFEVVIVDNGKDSRFLEYINKITCDHPNIRYKRIECSIFMNEIEAYKMANGDFIKFINHRTVLLPDTLKKWISFVEENIETKPVVYFANGELDKYYDACSYDSFDGFIDALGIFSSWSTGMAMWKEDIEDLSLDNINELFPHTCILFKKKKAKRYIVDNRIYLREVQHSSAKKGKYDLFYAFAVEYLDLLLGLYRSGDIKVKTFLKLKEKNLDFIIENYRTFCINKVECSYELNSFDSSIDVFYSHEMVINRERERISLFKKEMQHRLDRMRNQSDLKVIYGAGKVGREFLMENGKDNIVCFIDRSEYKQGKTVCGIPVVSIEEFLDENIDANIIVCVKKCNFTEEEMKLIDAGMNYCYWKAN